MEAGPQATLGRVSHATVIAMRETAGSLVRRAGVPSIARRIKADRRAGILVYHNPEPAMLERHLDYLAGRHRFVPYAAIADAVRSGDWAELPPKSIAVTFDDGHAGNAALAPVLERLGIVATMFVCTGVIGTRRRFWWEADGLSRRERYRLMRLPDEERIRTLERLGGWSPTREYESGTPQALSLDAARDLAGRVCFEAHTRWHPILPQCTDQAAEEEIAGSKRDVEAIFRRDCLHFAYPHGRYGAREVELAKRAGFRSARTTEVGWNEPGTDPFRLRVLGIPDEASLGVLAAQSTGWPALRRFQDVK